MSTINNALPGMPAPAPSKVVQFRNKTTGECIALTVPYGTLPWAVLTKRKERSLAKGHVWVQLAPVDPKSVLHAHLKNPPLHTVQ